MKIRLYLLSILAIVWLPAGMGEVSAAVTSASGKRVLYINSYNSGYPWSNDVMVGFRGYFEQRSVPVTIDTMELNVLRNVLLSPDKEDVIRLRKQLAQTSYDLVVAFGNPAADLFFDGTLEVPASAQLLFSGYSQCPRNDSTRRLARATGLYMRHKTHSMLLLGQSLFPHIKQVVVITDGSASGNHIRQCVDQHLVNSVDPVRLTQINGTEYSTEQMIDAVRALPSDALVIFHNWGSAKENLHEPLAMTLDRLASVSPVPILGRMVSLSQPGVAGGIFPVGRSLGCESAVLAERLLNGARAADIPVSESASQVIADFQALQKWGVSDSMLPEETIWLRRPAAFIVRYRQGIIGGGIAALAGCFALIGFLVIRLRRKRLERLIFRSLPVRVTVVDGKGEVLFRQWSGENEGTLRNVRYWRDFPAEVHEALDGPLNEVLTQGGSRTVEFDSAGRRRRAQVQAVPNMIFGKPAVMLSSHDIEELYFERCSKATLMERFQLTLDSIGDGVIAVDADGVINLINPVAAELLGSTVAALQGRQFQEIFRLEDSRLRQPLASPVSSVLESGRQAEFIPCADLLDVQEGRRRISIAATPMKRGVKGEVSGVVLICRDVGREYEQLEQMHVQNELLRSSADIAAMAYFHCDETGTVIMRPTSNSFWKYGDNEIAYPVEVWVHPDDQAFFLQSWSDLLAGRMPDFAIDYRAGENKQWRYYEMRVRAGRNMITGKKEYIGLIRDIHAAKISEQQRVDTMMLLESIINNLPSFISIRDVDDEFRYVLCNRAYEAVFSADWIGKRAEEILPQQVLEPFTRLDSQLPVDGETKEHIISITDCAGHSRQFKVFRKLLTKADGKRLLLGMNVDITNELKRETELADATLLLQSVMDNLPGYVFVKEIKENFRYLRANRMLSDFLGVSNEAMIGRNDKDFFADAAESATFREDDLAALENGGMLATVRPFTGSDGVRHIGKWFRRVLNRADGARLLLGIVVDITEQTDIHDRLRDANNILQSIMDTIEIPILLFSPELKLVRANNAAQRIAEEIRPGVSNGSCERIFHAAETRPEDCPVLNTSRDGQLHRHNMRLGERDFVSVAAPVMNRGEMIYVLNTLVDMTEANLVQRKLAQAVQDARNADKAKSCFLATMSHELRTPLNAVIGFSELLQNAELPKVEQLDYLHSINLAGNALLNLINDVLDLSKIEAEQLEIIPHPTDVGELLDEIYAIFRQKAEEKGLRFKVDCPTGMPLLELDSLRLRQILFNLTGNALKFTADGFVSVQVRFEPDDNGDGKLVCEVRDSGIGIKPEYLKRIFEPFVQQDSQRDSSIYKGTGLGLSISLRLVERMGGSLTVESKEGTGSLFRFVLPKVSSAAIGGAQTVLSEAKTDAGAHDCRIMVVDDVEMNRKVLVAMLRKLGYEAVAAASGEEALQKMHDSGHPDLLLTDMWMPQMNGSELADRVRQVPEWRNMRVIAITADTEAVANFDMSKIDAVLLKPVTLEKMQNTLNEYLDGSLGDGVCRRFR